MGVALHVAIGRGGCIDGSYIGALLNMNIVVLSCYIAGSLCFLAGSVLSLLQTLKVIS
jgi:hypothetical protein